MGYIGSCMGVAALGIGLGCGVEASGAHVCVGG